MAGGIDWFRWHHGSVTDPKFQLVARKAGVRLPDVLAVWAFLLETASASNERGSFGEVDCEAVDCLFGLEDGRTALILEHMDARGLVDDNRVTSWEKRQPKKEDESAAERKRRQREREHELRLAAELATTVTPTVSQEVTACHAEVTQCHDREEESREEVSKEQGYLYPPMETEGPSPFGAACLAMKAVGLSDTSLGNPKLRALVQAGATVEEFVDAARKALSAKAGFSYALTVVENSRKAAATMASQLHQGTLPAAETAYQRSMRERMAEVAPDFARKAPGQPAENATDFFNAIDVTARTVELLK